MPFTQSYINSDTITVNTQATLHKTAEKPSDQHSWTVLDDPSFRRLLRDGHCADATAALLTQLQGKE